MRAGGILAGQISWVSFEKYFASKSKNSLAEMIWTGGRGVRSVWWEFPKTPQVSSWPGMKAWMRMNLSSLAAVWRAGWISSGVLTREMPTLEPEEFGLMTQGRPISDWIWETTWFMFSSFLVCRKRALGTLKSKWERMFWV